jgi:hypothetical protein
LQHLQVLISVVIIKNYIIAYAVMKIDIDMIIENASITTAPLLFQHYKIVETDYKICPSVQVKIPMSL